jgi:hypothetical protein
MRTAQDYEVRGYAPTGSDRTDPEGIGWVTFAVVMLGIAGTWNFVAGILAISSSKVFVANADYVFSDLNTWGWIVMVLGVLQGFAAVALLGGSEVARWFGIVVAGLNAIGQLMFVPAYPWWALAMFSVDVLVVYGLARYAGSPVRMG